MNINYSFIKIYYREILLSLAIVLHGLFSYPMPVSPGLAEVIIGVLLAISIGIPFIFGLIKWWKEQETLITKIIIVFLFISLLVCPLFTGFLNGWGVVDIVRDIIPLCFLFLPLFSVVGWGLNNKYISQIFPLLICLAGLCFAIRFFIIADRPFYFVGHDFFQDGLKYLSYDPSVIFAAIFLPIFVIYKSLDKGIKNSFALIALVASFVCYQSLVAVLQRGPVALILFSLFIAIVFACIFFKKRAKLFLVLSLFLLISYSQFFVDIETFGEYINADGYARDHYSASSLMLAKGKQNGLLNSKGKEFILITDIVFEKPSVALLGIGWGGIYHNKYINNDFISFTHSVVSYFLLKTGMLGLLSFFIYAVWCVRNLFRLLIQKNLYFLAFASPLVITLLQTTYKTLSLGLILLLLVNFNMDNDADKYIDRR